MLQRELRALCIIIKIQGSNKHGQKNPHLQSKMKRAKIQVKKTLWLFFYITGSYITFTNVKQNYQEYRSYNSVQIERHSAQAIKFFRKVVICRNSMHSAKKGDSQI